MGLYPQPSAPESLFWGGAEGGGGGWRLLCAPTHARGGSPVGAPSGLADNTRWRPLGSWAPSRKNLGFAGGDSAIWYGMVWYGMVWYGMVWYGMLLLLLLRAPSTCRREKLPGTLSLGRAQGSSRPASRWPGVCRRRPSGGGGGGAAMEWRGGGGVCVRGGGCGYLGARVAVRGTTCPCDPGSLPRRGGRACAPVRNGGGMGGGVEGPPVRGPAGPRFPSLPAATPPLQGRGLRPVRRWSKGGEGGGDCVWSIPWCPPLCPVCGRPRGTARGGAQAWAGRVGSGGRPRRRRRHAGAGPVAVAGRCGRTGRRPAVALRAPLHGVGGRAGGTRAAQAWPWGARVQGRGRARCGPHYGPRD